MQKEVESQRQAGRRRREEEEERTWWEATNLELLDEDFTEEFLDWDVVLLGCWSSKRGMREGGKSARGRGRERETAKEKQTNPKRR